MGRQLIQSYLPYCLCYNFPFCMSIRKIVGMENSVDDFQLQISPRTITLPQGCRAFVLYLEKGMQVIGKFESSPGAVRDGFYRFRHPQPAAFRLNNLAHATYAWTLYSITPNEEESFEDSAAFNIERTVKLYQVELLEKEREVQTSVREKNVSRRAVLEVWGQLRKEMKGCKSVQKCLFANQDYQIEFTVEIKNTLDFQLEKMQEEEQTVSMRRVRSDQLRSSHSDVKYKPPPNVIELDSAPYRSLPQLKEEEVNTKETIDLDVGSIPIEEGHGTTSLEDFNATVKIVNPLGEELDDKQDAFLAGARKDYSEDSSQYNYPTPMKKFSLLSDIIERSHEGSSSYHPDRSSSNGHLFPLRKDNTIDLVLEPRLDPPAEPLSKFKTLPYESHHHLDVSDEFRRAQTAEKTLSEVQSSQIQESYLSANEQQAIPQAEGRIKTALKRLPVKWSIVAFLVLAIAVAAVVWSGARPEKKPKRRPRTH